MDAVDSDDEGSAQTHDQYIDLANSQEEIADTRAAAGAPEYYGFDPRFVILFVCLGISQVGNSAGAKLTNTDVLRWCRDFENPYDQVPPDLPEFEDYGAGYDDYIEDISDHEVRCFDT